MDKYDVAVAAILADPRVASDASDGRVANYLSAFTPNNPFPLDALAAWAQDGLEGRFYRPGPQGTLTRSTVVAVEPPAGSEIAFEVCTINSLLIVNASGTAIGSQGGAASGQAVARQVGGHWRLEDLTQSPATTCPTAGNGS